MSYESRSYDDEWGEPVIVLVVKGQHDVSRTVSLFNTGAYLVDHISVGEQMLTHVRTHEGGRAALELLRKHGGPNFVGGCDCPHASESPDGR